MTPIELLAILVGVTVLAWAGHAAWRQIRRRQLQRLAVEWQMGYAERDLFNLAIRIAPQLPVPAAADLRVLDLLHGSEGDQHRYVFTVEYTRGVVSGHRREQQVMTFCEPRDAAAERTLTLVAAPEGLPILEQYRDLHNRGWGATKKAQG